MSAYIPPEKMTEAQIREQLDAEYKHWDDLKKNGCSDPAAGWCESEPCSEPHHLLVSAPAGTYQPDRAALDVRRWYGFEERAAVAAGSSQQLHGPEWEVPR